MKRLVLMNIPAWISAMRKNTNCAVVLLVLAVVTAGCTKTIPVNDENGDDLQVSNVNFTPCQQTKAKSAELSGNVDVAFTNEGVQITYADFEVTCDFTAVDVTFTFENGFLNITQKGSPNQAKCVCYTDVSYTINGISQNKVNVIFINGVQVYCYNNQGVSKPVEEGIYTGTFTVRYASSVPERWLWESKSGKTTLELKEGKYTCTGNRDFIPAGGSGNYSINGSKIKFEDVKYWTANFDWNLILDGEYDYRFDGKHLKFSAFKNDVGYYEYDLEKVSVSNCDKDVIISQTEYENAPNAHVEIIDMKIVDNCLKIKFSASGCDGRTWKVELIDFGLAAESIPCQRTLRLSLESNEVCAAWITKEMSFNIEDLQIRGDHSVILHISGKTILYEY